MSDTDRVQRWRQRMREQGKEPVTLWLSREVKLRLEDLATSRSTTAGSSRSPGPIPAWQPCGFCNRSRYRTVTGAPPHPFGTLILF